jgi:hypothetical protein
MISTELGNLTRSSVMGKEGRKKMAKKPTNKQQAKVAKVMHEWKAGKLHGGVNPKGPKKAPIVKSQKQARAIALSQAGISKNKRR